MKSSDFFFNLPEELIAQHPVEPRDASRLLVYDVNKKEIEHKQFRNIADYLKKGDVLVVNRTRVIPARIFADIEGYSRKVEILLLKRLSYSVWEALVKPGKKMKIGTVGSVGDKLQFKVTGIKEDGERLIEFNFNGVFENILEEIGNIPLPPYIKEKLENGERYQTVYSRELGSAAAPTAGLHFTDELLEKIKQKGVEIAEVILHIGLGTFRPVKVENIEEHHMHTESYFISDEAANKINKAVDEKRRIICVGTTSVRVLESVADEYGHVKATSGETNIFIYPGYKFKIVRNLITNFHLPESTLIMLVSALVGKDETLKVYNEAIKEKYRFFSFGDATFFYSEN